MTMKIRKGDRVVVLTGKDQRQGGRRSCASSPSEAR